MSLLARERYKSVEEGFRRVSEIINLTIQGKLQCLVDVTLTANTATTIVNTPYASIDSHFSFDPMTANAATEKANGTIYVLEANRGKQTFTITHANNAQTDRKFRITIIG